MKTAQYTIRNVPKDLDARLRAISARTKQSLNKVIIDQLDKSVKTVKVGAKKLSHDFDEFFGSTSYDPKFEKALREQRQVDPRDW